MNVSTDINIRHTPSPWNIYLWPWRNMQVSESIRFTLGRSLVTSNGN